MNLKDITNVDKDQLLGLLGLERTPSTAAVVLRAIGLIGLGAVLGAGVGLLLAPQSGRDLREDLSRRLKNGVGRGIEHAREALDEGQLAGT